jgi:5-methylcytosine-specific restriction endonuclease McrA
MQWRHSGVRYEIPHRRRPHHRQQRSIRYARLQRHAMLGMDQAVQQRRLRYTICTMSKTCKKCGSTEFYVNGACGPCNREAHRKLKLKIQNGEIDLTKRPPCKICGSSRRNARGDCMECNKARNAKKKFADYTNSKPCKKCGGTKRTRSGHCSDCHNIRTLTWYRNNPEAAKLRSIKSRTKHAGKIKARDAQYRKNNPEKGAARTARHRAARIRATPRWADINKINEFYFTANMLGMHTGDMYHVDHIVPLQSKIVCGLHWEANLQILEGPENSRKGNRYWPDMP